MGADAEEIAVLPKPFKLTASFLGQPASSMAEACSKPECFSKTAFSSASATKVSQLRGLDIKYEQLQYDVWADPDIPKQLPLQFCRQNPWSWCIVCTLLQAAVMLWTPW